MNFPRCSMFEAPKLSPWLLVWLKIWRNPCKMIVDLRNNHSSSQLWLTLALNLISSQAGSMHTKSAMKRTISCTSKSAWKFIFFLVASVIWDHLLERTTRGNSEVKPLPAKPPNCRAAIFVFLIHQWLSVYKLAPGPLVLEKKPWIYRKIPGLTFFKDPFWGVYFWRGLYSEELIYGGNFACQNRLG